MPPGGSGGMGQEDGEATQGAGEGGAERRAKGRMTKAIIAEVNVLRRDPAAYAEGMAMLRSSYDGSLLTYPGSGEQVQTSEGVAALADCLRDLRSAEPMPHVALSEAVSSVCEWHLADLQQNDFCAHIGSDGSTPEMRLAQVGEYREQCGENVVFGISAAKEVVLHMLLDDGAPERGHRANLLNADFRFVGLGFGAHPSTGSAMVMLLADHFRAKPPGRAAQMRGIAEDALGEAALDHPTINKVASTHRHWDRLVQETKPDHLKVPRQQVAHVQFMHTPELYKDHARVPRILLGTLRPQPGMDPVIVRSFVHRMDLDRDDRFAEPEIQSLCHQNQLDISPDQVAQMFDEIIELRHKSERNRRCVDWNELFAAMQPKKRFVQIVDINVELESGSKCIITVESELLAQWSRELREEHILRCPGLAASPSSSQQTGAKAGALKVAEANIFLESLLSAELPGGQLLQDDPKVQQMLGGGLSANAPFARAICMSQRRLWAYPLRPHRSRWLQLFRAAGLDPLVPIPERKAAVGAEIAARLEEGGARVRQTNVARPDATAVPAVPPSQRKMATRDLGCMGASPKKPVAEKACEGGDNTRFDGPGGTKVGGVPHWDEKRHHAESIINQVVGDKGSFGSAARSPRLMALLDKHDLLERPQRGAGSPIRSAARGLAPPDMDSKMATAPVAFTFEARRKFQQVLATHSRASDEQSFLGAEQRMARSLGSATNLRGTRCVHGAHSLSAPAGPRGHFHNTHAVHAADGGHGWPRSLDVRWEGAHLDHTKMPEMKPNPRYSKMDPSERAQQFSSHFGNASSGDSTSLKARAAEHHTLSKDKYSFSVHQHRDDQPQRHGKFGRRTFDPQVKERMVSNAHGMSEIETKPSEVYYWQQERDQDRAERALPPQHNVHFKANMVASEQPGKYQELASGAKVQFHSDGGTKQTRLGYLQCRMGDKEQDMKLYTRPLLTSQMDRRIPLT